MVDSEKDKHSRFSKFLTGIPEEEYDRVFEKILHLEKKIVRQKNPFIKKVMEFVFNQHVVNPDYGGQASYHFSYVLDNIADWIEEEVEKQTKAFPIVEGKLELIANLEEIISRSTSSDLGNSSGDLSSKRYPLRVPHGNLKNKSEIRSNIVNALPEHLLGSHYQFGVHGFYVVEAIVNTLKYLEDRYDINFRELEEKLNNDSKS